MTLAADSGHPSAQAERVLSRFAPSPPSEPQQITVVIPVRNHRWGIERFLSTFIRTHSPMMWPQEIIVVDDGSPSALPDFSSVFDVPVRVLRQSAREPAAARNLGARMARTDWLLFTDSDCVPTDSWPIGYLACRSDAVAYAGQVRSYGSGWLSRYYEEQGILVPPPDRSDAYPAYLVTANCMVWWPAFWAVGGFCEEIRIAGGEDVDLAFRLRSVGKLDYAPESVVLHDFNDGLIGFIKRFLRYGYANRVVARRHQRELKPKPFPPKSGRLSHVPLAHLQYVCMKIGYSALFGRLAGMLGWGSG